MADDFAALQARIVDDIRDTSLSSQVALKINEAIRYYSREKWPFLEASTSFNTVAGTQAYSLPTDYKSMLNVKALVSGSFWPMTSRTFKYLNDITVLTTTLSPPQDYAIFDNQIWLYPIPDKAYAITEYYDKILPALSAGADANIWTQDGADLIVTKAEQLLYNDVIENDSMAAAMGQKLIDLYANFRAGYNQWQASGKIMPVYL